VDGSSSPQPSWCDKWRSLWDLVHDGIAMHGSGLQRRQRNQPLNALRAMDGDAVDRSADSGSLVGLPCASTCVLAEITHRASERFAGKHRGRRRRGPGPLSARITEGRDRLSSHRTSNPLEGAET
jgi:hypothetical protein